jgi:predicted ATPase
MGKSSVIQSLLLLRQSSKTSMGPVRELLLSGNLVDLGTGADVFYDNAEEDEIGIAVEFTLNDPFVRVRLSNAFPYDRTAATLKTVERHSPSWFLVQEEGTERGWRRALPAERPELLPQAKNSLLRSSGFQYLCAERLGPRKVLPVSEERVRRRDLGKQGEYVLHYLLHCAAELLDETDPRHSEHAGKATLLDQTMAWLQEVSPGTRLNINLVEAADMALARFSFARRGDIPTREMRPTNVGFGLSYVLPVIVALLGAKTGDLVIIENPEAHLHPRGQTRLGQLAARAAAAGVQVIIETHSDHLLDGVRIDVRNRRIAPDGVRIHYFERDGAEAIVKSPDIDAEGRLSDWPKGFFDQHDENLIELLAPVLR